MSTDLFLPNTDTEIMECFDAFKVLRPHLERDQFLLQVRRQQQQSYQIVALRDGCIVPSAAGYRFAEFLVWGSVLYVDDLTTLPEYRGRGHGEQLLDWMIDLAKSRGCRGLHLDTGYARHAAQKLYLRKGLHMSCHHLTLEFC